MLSLDESELLVKVLTAQKKEPVKNDWCLQVKEDLEFLELNEEQIRSMKKDKFKLIVKAACKKTAFKYLLKEQENVQSKMGNIKYRDFKMQEYLKTEEISTKLKKLAFKLRLRMVRVSNNMGIKGPCPLCKHIITGAVQYDTQEHLIGCVILKEKVQEIRENTEIKMNDIFSDNIMKVKMAVELLSLIHI